MAADETNDRRSLDTGPTFSLIRSLIADRRTREASGCIFVEGIRNFITALDQGWSVQTIVYSERLLIAPVARKWVRSLKRGNTPYCRVTPEQFRSMSCAQRACRSRSNSASEDRWSRTGVGPRSRVLDGGWSNPHAGESGHTHALGLRCRCRWLLSSGRSIVPLREIVQSLSKMCRADPKTPIPMEEVARRLKLTLPEVQRAALFLARSPAHPGVHTQNQVPVLQPSENYVTLGGFEHLKEKSREEARLALRPLPLMASTGLPGDIGVMWDLRAVVPWTNQARGYLVMAHHDGHERWKSGSLPGSGPGHFPMIPT
jgi:hypothetical protein